MGLWRRGSGTSAESLNEGEGVWIGALSEAWSTARLVLIFLGMSSLVMVVRRCNKREGTKRVPLLVPQ